MHCVISGWCRQAVAWLDRHGIAYETLDVISDATAYSEMLHWSVLGHADVLRILQDHERFSNVVSRHVAVPNGMDPPEHTAYRALIEPYFTQERVEAFRPVCERITAELLQALQGRREVDWVAAFALPFAVRIQCAFMG